jgi:hypothetical protein
VTNAPRTLDVPQPREWNWTTQVTLSTAVILHVAVWQRWPVPVIQLSE